MSLLDLQQNFENDISPETVSLEEESTELENQIKQVKSLYKLEILNIWQSSMRAIMLLNLLEVPGFTYIGPISITFLGIAQNLIGIAR